MLEQHGGRGASIALIADELRGKLQCRRAVLERDGELAAFHAVRDGVDVRAVGERRGFVEEGAGTRDHARAADYVEVSGALRAVGFGDGVGAVKRVVQAAPARIRGVECVALVRERHDELRAGLRGDFGVDVLESSP